MLQTYRYAFYAGLILALFIGIWLVRLWQPERQVQRHGENLLRAVEAKDWKRVNEFVAPEYTDQWHNDGTQLVERTREVFRYLRDVRLSATETTTTAAGDRGDWQARIVIDGQATEVMAAVKERVNSLTTPFDLQWRHMSGKPWDWKLVRASNPGLSIPEAPE